MRQHRKQAALWQGQHQGQAHAQGVVGGAKQAVARALHDEGVVVVGHHHAVDERAAHLALHSAQQPKQLGRFLLGDVHPLRRGYAHQQRAQRYPHNDQATDAQGDDRKNAPLLPQGSGPQQHDCAQHHAGQGVGIAQSGKPHHMAAVGGGVVLGIQLTQADEVQVVGLLHACHYGLAHP